MRKNKKSTTIDTKFKVQCSCCGGWSQSPRNVKTCTWCDGQVHSKCLKNQLGCLKCCNELIPGYNTTSYELNMDYNRLNDYLFNPYARSYLLNSTGNTIEDEAQNNEFWNKISKFLIVCSYKQQKNVKVSTENELKSSKFFH